MKNMSRHMYACRDIWRNARIISLFRLIHTGILRRQEKSMHGKKRKTSPISTTPQQTSKTRHKKKVIRKKANLVFYNLFVPIFFVLSNIPFHLNQLIYDGVVTIHKHYISNGKVGNFAPKRFRSSAKHCVNNVAFSKKLTHLKMLTYNFSISWWRRTHTTEERRKNLCSAFKKAHK